MVDLGLLLNWLAVIILICVATIAVMSTASGAIALISWALRLGSLLWVPTPTGVRPIDRRAVTAAGTGLVDRAEQVAAIRASQPAPPHIAHYHAHTSGGQTTATVSKTTEQQSGTTTRELPAPLTLSQALTWTPTLDRILVGVDHNSHPLVVTAAGLCHVALAGTTGNGKSSIMRLLLGQLLAAGADVAIADPHYAPLDPANGEDWRPIERRLIEPPAVQARQINDLLAWTVGEIDRRLEARRTGQPASRPLFLAVDELPIIIAQLPGSKRQGQLGAADYLGRLVREGRKVGVFGIVSSQDFLTDTIGSAGAVRDCYRTAYYVGGDLTTARVMLDRSGTINDTGLGAGAVMLRCPATPTAQLARVPLVTNEDLARLLPSPDDRSAPVRPVLELASPNGPNGAYSWERSAVRSDDEMSPSGPVRLPERTNERTNEREREQIAAAIAAGQPKQATLLQLFGVRKGDNASWRHYSTLWDTAKTAMGDITAV